MAYRDRCVEKWQKKLDKAQKLRREYGDKWWQSMNKDIENIKFKYLDIISMEPFSSIKPENVAFDKCKLDAKIINDLNKLTTNKNENED